MRVDVTRLLVVLDLELLDDGHDGLVGDPSEQSTAAQQVDALLQLVPLDLHPKVVEIRPSGQIVLERSQTADSPTESRRDKGALTSYESDPCHLACKCSMQTRYEDADAACMRVNDRSSASVEMPLPAAQ